MAGSEHEDGGVPRPPGESFSSYRWFLGNKSQRNPEKVNSLIYKDYTLVKREDGTKSYVSPEEKAQLILEEKLKTSKISIENEKEKPPPPDSDSDSGYEIPVDRKKPKSCDNLDRIPPPEVKRHSSFPNSLGEWSPGDNGRINLPPHIIPLETNLGEPETMERRSSKKKRAPPMRGDEEKRFSLPWGTNKRATETEESPEDAEVREITEGRRFSVPDGSCDSKAEGRGEDKIENQLDEPVEIFPEHLETTKGRSSFFRLQKFPNEPLKSKRTRNSNVDRNPLRKMFGAGARRGDPPAEDSDLRSSGSRGRYGDAALSHILSDTESADHGSADKSSMSKLTSERQPKNLMSGLFGSFRMGRNKDKVADNDPARNPSSFEITVKEQPEELGQTEITRPEGIVYAELDMTRSPGSVMRRDDEKTEYAEIIYPGSKLSVERATEELRKSRENLTSSRENLTEVDEAYSTTPDGKKEAAV